jgi:hypothetical protein
LARQHAYSSLFHKPDPALPLANSDDSGEGDSVGRRPIGRQSSSEGFTLSAPSELIPFVQQAHSSSRRRATERPHLPQTVRTLVPRWVRGHADKRGLTLLIPD